MTDYQQNLDSDDRASHDSREWACRLLLLILLGANITIESIPL